MDRKEGTEGEMEEWSMKGVSQTNYEGCTSNFYWEKILLTFLR